MSTPSWLSTRMQLFSAFFSPALIAGVAALALVAAPNVCRADEPAAEEEEEEEEKIPDPEPVTLTTKDYVKIHCTFYPSPLKDPKKAVPVVMVHGWGGQRGEYDALASKLQEESGCAVIVPDLRGHGASTVQRLPGSEKDEVLDFEKMTKFDIGKMSTFDLEAVKQFLYERNNEGELNIDALTVIAAEEGALVAINWAYVDWTSPTSEVLIWKRARWIKSLVLLSPVTSYKGVTATFAMQLDVLKRDMSMMIAVGEDDRVANGKAKKFHLPLDRLRHDLTGENKNLYFIPIGSKLQGTKLLGRAALRLDGYIAKFIQLRVTNLMADKFPWLKREKPLG